MEVLIIMLAAWGIPALIFGLVMAYLDGRSNSYSGDAWTVFLWPLMLVLVIAHGPFYLARWLGERARRREMMRQTGALGSEPKG